MPEDIPEDFGSKPKTFFFETKPETARISYERPVVLPELTLENMRDWERKSLLREVAYRADHGKFPNETETEALLCCFARFEARSEPTEHFNQVGGEEGLPWPDGAKKTDREINDHLGYLKWEDELIDLVADSESLGLLIDTDDNNSFHTALHSLIEKMPPQDRVVFNRFILNNWDKLTSYIGFDSFDYFSQYLLTGLDSDSGLELGNAVVDFIDKQDQQPLTLKGITDPDVKKAIDDDIFDFVDRIRWMGGEDFVYRAIAQEWQGEAKREANQKTLLNFIRTPYSDVPIELFKIRNLAKTKGISIEEVQGYEGMIRFLLKLPDESPAFKDIDELYAKIDFSQYPLSEATRIFRTQSLETIFQANGIARDARIMDLACGTGWLANDLINAGYTNTTGVDKSEKNVGMAKAEFPTVSESFKIGDWRNLTVFGKFEAVVCMGRSIPHVEDERQFGRVIDNVWKTLDENGLFIFDLPDPEKGSHAQGVQAYRQFLYQLGFPSHYVDDSWYIVDSPDGENFYNRFVPSKELVVNYLRSRGFEIVAAGGGKPGEPIEEDMPGKPDDKNLVFVCRKLKERPYLRKYMTAGIEEAN